MAWTIEYVGIIFIAIMVYLTYLEYKRKKLTKLAFFFWNIVWLGGLILIVAHQQINIILPTLNIIRAMDLYMILAFMLLFSVIFYLYRTVNSTEKRLEALTRILALNQINSKENKDNKSGDNKTKLKKESDGR